MFDYAIADPEINDSRLVLNGQIVANRVRDDPDGDYNEDGFVDRADYLVWEELSGTSDSRVDGDNSGTVGSEDYQSR